MSKLHTLLIVFLVSSICSAQIIIDKPTYLRFPKDSVLVHTLTTSLDNLFSNLNEDKGLDQFLMQDQVVLTTKTLNIIKEYNNQYKNDTVNTVSHQLSNVYPINNTSFKININGFLSRSQKSPTLLYSIRLIAKEAKEGFKFSIPLKIETKYWKIKKIGNITYHYRNDLNINRAKLFNKKNNSIANKFGLKPETLTMYMCNNYQKILQLRGIDYSVNDNGLYRDGYGVVDNTIFSVMHNEDFSHDMLHYYSGKINKRENRNWITEEGLAYLWGNAYYTDLFGKMITQTRLVLALKTYLKQNPNTSLLQLFKEDTKLFNHIASEVSVRSVLAAIIVNEVETQKGAEGILKLINAGQKDRMVNFLKVTDVLIGLNENNFNKKISRFLKRL